MIAYPMGEIGTVWTSALIVREQYNIRTVDLGSAGRVYVRFFRPDGTTFEKDAVVSGKFIKYADTGESILNQIGMWQWAVGVEWSDGSTQEDTHRNIFWVLQ